MAIPPISRHVPSVVLPCLLALAPGAAGGMDLYVSPRGNDAWSGRSSEPDAAGTDGPVASLEGARVAIRAWRARSAAPEPVRVLVADGRYVLGGPFVLEPEDGGTAAAPVSYEAASGARPVFSGGRAISGFRPGPEGVWMAEVPDVAADPLFLDPAKGDFRLAPSSPALALGFRPFDPSKAGVRGDAAWIEKANGESYPPLQLPPGSP